MLTDGSGAGGGEARDGDGEPMSQGDEEDLEGYGGADGASERVGARGTREPSGAGGLMGYGGEEGARSHGGAAGLKGRGRVQDSEPGGGDKGSSTTCSAAVGQPPGVGSPSSTMAPPSVGFTVGQVGAGDGKTTEIKCKGKKMVSWDEFSRVIHKTKDWEKRENKRGRSRCFTFF